MLTCAAFTRRARFRIVINFTIGVALELTALDIIRGTRWRLHQIQILIENNKN